MNMVQDRQMHMVKGNDENQFRQYAGQNVGNHNGYNAVQNVRNQVVQNVVQNPRVQNVGNKNRLIVVSRIANQNPNGNVNLVAERAEGNMTGNNAYLDEIEEVNANCILMANLQQASTSVTQTDKAVVYDSDGSAEYTELLEPIPEPHQVPQNANNVIFEVSSVEQSGGIVEQRHANVEETHLNKQLSMEKSTNSTLLEEKKKLKSDFKIREDELLDKQIQLENKIKKLDNILVKTDDAIFMGEWDRNNVESLIQLLNIFYLASGLQLNLQKSKLYRIGVTYVNVQELARCTGCGADSLPFIYLGLLVGERIYRVNSWRHLGWNIIWRREIHGGIELFQHTQLMSCIQVIRINSDQDVRQWKFVDEESFTVRFVRNSLDVIRLSISSTATRWCKILPIKVSVFVWRVMLNRLPTHLNLDRRGIDMDSLLRPCCNSIVEDSNHVFYSCNVALELWNKIAVWLDLHIPGFDNMSAMFQ
nr:RNA-directed DNA polymerase, eukaryota [Tanacetum cinerariifolium]